MEGSSRGQRVFFFKRIELQLKDDTTRPFNNCVSKHASHTAIANQIMSAEVQSSEEDVLASTHGPDSSLAGANQFSNEAISNFDKWSGNLPIECLSPSPWTAAIMASDLLMENEERSGSLDYKDIDSDNDVLPNDLDEQSSTSRFLRKKGSEPNIGLGLGVGQPVISSETSLELDAYEELANAAKRRDREAIAKWSEIILSASS